MSMNSIQAKTRPVALPLDEDRQPLGESLGFATQLVRGGAAKPTQTRKGLFMLKAAKFVHLLALAAFVGGIFTHIVIGALAVPDMHVTAVILKAKTVVTTIMMFSGLGLLLLSGVTMVVARGGARAIRPWLKVKLALVALVLCNAFFVLAPVGEQRLQEAAAAAAGEPLAVNFGALGLREDIFGAINLLMVLGIVVLSVRRQVLR